MPCIAASRFASRALRTLVQRVECGQGSLLSLVDALAQLQLTLRGLRVAATAQRDGVSTSSGFEPRPISGAPCTAGATARHLRDRHARLGDCRDDGAGGGTRHKASKTVMALT